ncbi:MAG: hypothetical protein JNK87_26860 [Bryobacterales bacterium]|nr:hypothetical protein [Bryobacterales bacterium]
MYFLYVFLLATGGPASAQTDVPAKPGLAKRLNFQGSVRTRVEAWDWFDNGSSEPYGYLGALARFSISQRYESFDWQVEVALPVLLNLPQRAVSPAPQGALGLGANYFTANDNSRNAAMLFPKQAFVRWHLPGQQSLRVGRFEFLDGSELTPKNATLAALKTTRVNQRLLGNFGWAHVQRAFDGFHYTLAKPGGTVTLIGAVPTRGVFQTDGWGWNKAAFSYASYAKATGKDANAGELRLFGLYYHDWRHVLKVDNRPLPARQADMNNIGVFTWGGHYLHTCETGAGTVDVMLWGALQNGRWGRLDHRGYAGDFEVGYQPKGLAWKPWLRGGYYRGSGDGNAADNKHGAFFQVLPTPRPFARFPFFNMMNNQDVFGMVTLRPNKAVSLTSEVHSLRLSASQDLWYQGGGVFQPWTFGYVGRPANGRGGLATLWDASLDWKVNANNTLSLYFGNAWGQGVVSAIYAKRDTARMGYVEWTVRF